MKKSTAEIVVMFAKLWGIKTADFGWVGRNSEDEYNLREMESWDSEELLTLLTRWAVEYEQSNIEDAVEFFEGKLETLLAFAKLRRDANEP